MIGKGTHAERHPQLIPHKLRDVRAPFSHIYQQWRRSNRGHKHETNNDSKRVSVVLPVRIERTTSPLPRGPGTKLSRFIKVRKMLRRCSRRRG
jgi:hypothetical protein